MTNQAELRNLITSSIVFSRPAAIDTQALLQYLADREPHASCVASILENRALKVIVSTLSIAEILSIPPLHVDPFTLAETLDAVRELPGIQIASFGEDEALETSKMCVRTGLPLPDCAIIATALTHGAMLLIGTNERWNRRDLGVRYVHLPDLVSSN